MMKETKFRFFLALVGGAFVLAACSQAAATGAPISENQGELEADFELTVYYGAAALGGETVQFSDVLAQGKPVVLNFWAGLCPPCRVEMPDLQEIYEEFDGQILIVGVDIGPFSALGTRDEGRALVKQLGVTYPTGTVFDGVVVIDYRVIGMPTTHFITPEGEIVDTWTGLLTKGKMTELVEALLVASGVVP